MAKRLMASWLPLATFGVVILIGVIAGPALGVLSKRVPQSATDCGPVCSGAAGDQAPAGGPLTGQSDSGCTASEAPVRYFNGQSLLAVSELQASGLSGWSHTRAISGPAEDAQLVGPGWKITGFLQLVNVGGAIAAINGSTSVRSFLDNMNGTYTAQLWYQDTLVVTAGNTLTMTDAEGSQWVFFDLSANWPAARQGRLKEFKDRAGTATTFIYSSTAGPTLDKVLEVQQTDTVPTTFHRFVYDYYLTGAPAGLLSSVTYQRSVGGSTTTVRKVDYTYYLPLGRDQRTPELPPVGQDRQRDECARRLLPPL